MEVIHVGFQHKRLAGDYVFISGYASHQAAGQKGCVIGMMVVMGSGKNGPPSERGVTWVWGMKDGFRWRYAARSARQDYAVLPFNLHIGPQPETAERSDERVGLFFREVQQERFFSVPEKEKCLDTSLCIEHGRPAGAIGRKSLYIIGYEAIQKAGSFISCQ